MMPLGHDGRRYGVGLESGFGVKGDFELTLRYEILQEPDARENGDGATGLTLRVDLENPTGDMASLSRSVRPNDGTRFSTYQRSPGKDQLKVFPAKVKSGQLRLVRTGAVLSHYVAEFPNDDFVFLYEHPFSDADLRRICVLGTTGGPKTSLDVSVTDFLIRADSILGAPAPAAEAESGSLGWWLVGVLALLAGAMTLALVLVAWLYLRQPSAPVVSASAKKNASKQKPVTSIVAAPPVHRSKQTKPEKPASALIFRCSDCGKTLKARPELAGKKVKCTQCGTPVPVPEKEE